MLSQSLIQGMRKEGEGTHAFAPHRFATVITVHKCELCDKLYQNVHASIRLADTGSVSPEVTWTVKGSSNGNDEIRVKVATPSDSPTVVELNKNSTPNEKKSYSAKV